MYPCILNLNSFYHLFSYHPSPSLNYCNSFLSPLPPFFCPPCNVLCLDCKSYFFAPLLNCSNDPTAPRIKSRHLPMAHKSLPDLVPAYLNLISYHCLYSGPATITSCLSS